MKKGAKMARKLSADIFCLLSLDCLSFNKLNIIPKNKYSPTAQGKIHSLSFLFFYALNSIHTVHRKKRRCTSFSFVSVFFSEFQYLPFYSDTPCTHTYYLHTSFGLNRCEKSELLRKMLNSKLFLLSRM